MALTIKSEVMEGGQLLWNRICVYTHTYKLHKYMYLTVIYIDFFEII